MVQSSDCPSHHSGELNSPMPAACDVATASGAARFTAAYRSCKSSPSLSAINSFQSMKSVYERIVLKRLGSTSSHVPYCRYHEAFKASSVPYFFRSQRRNRAMEFLQKQNSGFSM